MDTCFDETFCFDPQQGTAMTNNIGTTSHTILFLKADLLNYDLLVLRTFMWFQHRVETADQLQQASKPCIQLTRWPMW